MKIKLKVKHLIIIPIILFIIIPNLLYFVGRTMFSIGWQFDSGITTREYSYGVLNLYTKWPKVLSPFEGEAYFYMGRTKYDYNIQYVSNGFEQVIGGQIPFGSYEDALKLHEKGLKNSEGLDYSLNSVALFNLYMEKGEVEKAKGIIEDSLKKESYKENSAGKVLDIQLKIMEGNIDEAKKLYKEYYKESRNGIVEKMLSIDMDYYNVDKRNLGDKMKFYNEKSFLQELGDTINVPRVYELVKYDNEGKGEKIVGDVTIKGKITLEGKPLKYVPIIVGQVGFSEYTSSLSYGQVNGNIIYTDENGNYEIKKMPEMEITNVSPILSVDIGEKYFTEEKYLENTKNNKIYEVNLDYKERMKIDVDENLKLEGNKFDINFEKVEGADYYYTSLMFIDGISGMHEGIKTKENKVSVPLINGSFGTFKTYIRREYLMDTRDEADIIGGGEPVMEMGQIDETSYGGRYKKDEIDYVEVKAIKIVNGKEIIINSNRIKTNIEGKEVKENEGIKLLNEGKIEEGEEFLLNKIKEEGYRPEYIYPLIRLNTNHYTFDYSMNLKEFYTKERLDKAKKSEEVLLKELYKINENKDEISYLKGEYESFYQMYESEE
ncbi:MAG: tetratricopeptide repeat protein [Clostridium sp.]|uniref:tetratricopeptide repeat protein n=1 Tax=Clostridium sp. TaxID=1506 RepID=UPI003F318169